jgi:hypothetical protein
MVDFWRLFEVFNGTEFRLGNVGRVWRTCGSRRSCRRQDSYVAVFFLERVESKLAEVGRAVDFWQPFEKFNGT